MMKFGSSETRKARGADLRLKLQAVRWWVRVVQVLKQAVNQLVQCSRDRAFFSMATPRFSIAVTDD